MHGACLLGRNAFSLYSFECLSSFKLFCGFCVKKGETFTRLACDNVTEHP